MYTRLMDHRGERFRRLIVAKNWNVMRFFPPHWFLDDESNKNGIMLLAFMKSRGELVSYLDEAVGELNLPPGEEREDVHDLELVREACWMATHNMSCVADTFCSALEIITTDEVDVEDIYWLVSCNTVSFLNEMIIN